MTHPFDRPTAVADDGRRNLTNLNPNQALANAEAAA